MRQNEPASQTDSGGVVRGSQWADNPTASHSATLVGPGLCILVAQMIERRRAGDLAGALLLHPAHRGDGYLFRLTRQ